MRLVVDASVAVKWLVEEEHSDAADRLLDGNHELFAPRLMASEVGNALWRKVRMGELERSRAGALAAAISFEYFGPMAEGRSIGRRHLRSVGRKRGEEVGPDAVRLSPERWTVRSMTASTLPWRTGWARRWSRRTKSASSTRWRRRSTGPRWLRWTASSWSDRGRRLRRGGAAPCGRPRACRRAPSLNLPQRAAHLSSVTSWGGRRRLRLGDRSGAEHESRGA